MLANSLEAILLTTPGNGSIQQANPAAERLFGWTEAELCALGRGRIMDMSSLGAQNAVKQRGIAGHFTGEVTHFRKDGSKFPAQVSTFLFKDRHGNERACVLIRDISARQKAEAHLKPA